MGFELGSGTLYFENKPIGEIDSGLVEVEEDEFYIPSEPAIKIPRMLEATFTLKDLKRYEHRKILLMLFHGTKVSNNWLKYHGGVMTRQRAYLKHLRNKRREK